MERFYLKTKYTLGDLVHLEEGEHHHLLHVLRIKLYDEVELVNGMGALAKAKITHLDKRTNALQILSVQELPLPKIRIAVGVALMRPSKLEWIVEKGTELGADDFFFYIADKSTQRTLSEHQIERLRIITISALKQSKRLYLPSLEITSNLQSLFATESKILFGDIRTDAEQKPLQIKESTLFITGPESGFSEKELLLLDQKAQGIRLNPYVLRAETAPITALSILCYMAKNTRSDDS